MDVSCSGSTPIKRSNGRLTTSPSNEQASPQTWKNDTPGCSTATGGAAAVKMFRVLLDPPSAGAFFSGSEVRGHVQVDTEDEQKFKYIHISLTGRAQVSWYESSSQRNHTAHREYLHHTHMLWNREDEGGALFPAGLHSFPFSFILPPNIPSSFEGSVGWVRYELLSRIVTGVIKKEHVVEMDVPVVEVVDTNTQPLLIKPISAQVQRRVWCFPCTLANVHVSVSITRTGFCVGEDIPLNVSLENSSRYDVTITAILRQKITYTAKRNKRQYDKATVVRVSSHRFAAQTSTIWPTNLRVPADEATSQTHDPIHIEYRIKVVASVAWGQSLIAKIPITIGNIPYGESLVDTDIQCSTHDLDSSNHKPSVTSLLSDDGHLLHYTPNSQECVTSTPTPHSMSRPSPTVSTDTSCAHDSECTYSVQAYVNHEPSDLCLETVALDNNPNV
jgi:hypothetical protein